MKLSKSIRFYFIPCYGVYDMIALLIWFSIEIIFVYTYLSFQDDFDKVLTDLDTT